MMLHWFRRHAAALGLLGLVSFPNMPESPKPPVKIPVSLYVWNAANQPADLAVAVDGTWVFHETVAAGRGVSRPGLLTLVEGTHTGEMVAGTLRGPFSLTVTVDGNRWLVATWWGKGELDAGLQHQPPWIAGSSR